MSLFKRLFGGGGSASQTAPPETYQGFTIIPEPFNEGGKYRLAARIEKEVDGSLKSHQLIRADILETLDDAVAASVAKARQMIDEQGERLLR